VDQSLKLGIWTEKEIMAIALASKPNLIKHKVDNPVCFTSSILSQLQKIITKKQHESTSSINPPTKKCPDNLYTNGSMQCVSYYQFMLT